MPIQPFLYVKKKKTLPTEIVMPVEKNDMELLKQNMWIIPDSSKRYIIVIRR